MTLGFGCSDDTGGPVSLLAPNYASEYTVVRDCRRSGDHDFNYMRVLADPAATAAYQQRMSDFPVGSVIVKEEFDASDATCSGEIVTWTLMSRLAAGSAPTTLDWAWQRVLPDGTVRDDEPGCASCHRSCGVPPDGYLGTCTVP